MRRTIAAAAVLSILLLILPAQPAKAQWVVYDPVNWIENFFSKLESILQTYLAYEDLYHDIEDLYVAYKNLERIENPRWRDVLVLIDEIRDLAEYGDAIAYTLIAPLDRFLEAYPLELVFDAVAVHIGEDALTIQQYWRRTMRDVAAGAYSSSAESARDEAEEMNILSLALQELANDADGRDQHAQAQNMMLSALLGQTQKSNTHLTTLVNLLATQMGLEATLESASAETLEEFAYPFGWDFDHPYGRTGYWDPTP